VARVVAVDNEQYVATIRGRFGIHLEPGAGGLAIAELLHSRVDYRRLDAFDRAAWGKPSTSSWASVSCIASRRR
jgi:hypothetical protein